MLSACGVDSEDPAPIDAPTTINDIAMFGISAADADKDDTIIDLEVPMDRNQVADAIFEITWDVSSSDPYQVKIYISTDATFNEVTDQLFFGRQCGTGQLYNCNSIGSVDCGFRYNPDYTRDENGDIVFIQNPDNPGDPADLIPSVDTDRYYLRCVGDSTEITDRVENDGFPSLPVDQNIIFRACNHAGNNCIDSAFTLNVADSMP